MKYVVSTIVLFIIVGCFAQPGVVKTIAGNGIGDPGYGGDGGMPLFAKLNHPSGIAYDSNNNLIIADGDNCRLRKVDFTNNVITTIDGNGTCDDTTNGTNIFSSAIGSLF